MGNVSRENYKKYGWDNHTRGLYKCKICGEVQFIRNDYFKKCLQVCNNKCNGNVYGDNHIKVVIGYNNVAIEYPNKIKYFANKEDAFKYTTKSDVYVQLKCPHCGKMRNIKTIIANLTKQGFSCDYCGDGVPYPEKIVALVLKALGIRFKIQHRFDEYSYRYDFYLIDYDIIIEVHGEQHFKYTGFGRSYEKEHENDMIKYDLAVLHGYEYNKNYFVIDARKSNIKWLKNSIEQCNFFKQFNLSNIDWQEIDIQAQSSLRIAICKYWKEQKEINKNLTVVNLTKEFELDASTIRKYLTWGNDNCFCEYNAEEEKQAKIKRQSVFIYLVKPNGEKWFDEPMSQKELVRQSRISESTVRILRQNGESLKYSGKAKYDKKYIGSYIIDADEWDSQQNKENSDTSNN
jgi:predicted RNA-binding Zn-ribbon protein involved in translation (DUF1610 family)